MKYNYKVEVERVIYDAPHPNSRTTAANRKIEELEDLNTDVPVMKGDLVYGMPVVSINHTGRGTTLRLFTNKKDKGD